MNDTVISARPFQMPRGVLLAAAVVLVALSACTGASKNTKTTETTEGADKRPTPAANGEGPPPINAKAQRAFDDANKAYAAAKSSGKWDYPGLDRKYQAAADADPNLAEAVFNQGVLAERQGKFKEAASLYKKALDRKPTLHQASVNLAVIAQNSGDSATAEQLYTQIAQTYPEDAGSRARLAEIYRRKGEYEKAIQLAKEALFREPKTLQAYKVLMLTYYEQKQLSLAKLVALRASKIDENDPEISYTLGLISLAEKDVPKARVQFKRAAEIRPDYLPAHLQLARIALQQENYPAAEDAIRHILQADGKNAEAMVDLGVAEKGMGQFDKALATYDEAQKLKPDLPAIYLNKGFVLLAKNEPEKAIELFKLYQSKAPEAINGDHPVTQGIKDAEALIKEREEAKKAEEEAKKMEEEAKKAEDAAKADEAAKKNEELKKQQDQAKGNAAKDAAKGADTGEAKPDDKADKPPDKPAPTSKKGSGAAAPAGDAAKPPAPAKPASNKPKDEPDDAQ